MLSERLPVIVFQALGFGTAGISSCVVRVALLPAKFAAFTRLQKLHVSNGKETVNLCH